MAGWQTQGTGDEQGVLRMRCSERVGWGARLGVGRWVDCRLTWGSVLHRGVPNLSETRLLTEPALTPRGMGQNASSPAALLYGTRWCLSHLCRPGRLGEAQKECLSEHQAECLAACLT